MVFLLHIHALVFISLTFRVCCFFPVVPHQALLMSCSFFSNSLAILVVTSLRSTFLHVTKKQTTSPHHDILFTTLIPMDTRPLTLLHQPNSLTHTSILPNPSLMHTHPPSLAPGCPDAVAVLRAGGEVAAGRQGAATWLACTSRLAPARHHHHHHHHPLHVPSVQPLCHPITIITS